MSFYTQGEILSGDFDLVADVGFEPYLLAEGFIREDRQGRLLRGYYHPSTPRLGFEIVSGALFDGLSDENRITAVSMSDGEEVLFPSVEDLIADRLGQYAASGNRDPGILAQARLMMALAGEVDRDYLRRRIVEETGDPAQVGIA